MKNKACTVEDCCRRQRLKSIIGNGSIEGRVARLVIEERVGTADFASRRSC